MSESRHHKRYKYRDAGRTGDIEYELPSGKRLDVLTGADTAIEIERNGIKGIQKAVRRLNEAQRTGIAKKVILRVPEQDIDNAYYEMRRQRVGGIITNLSKSYREYVQKRRSR